VRHQDDLSFRSPFVPLGVSVGALDHSKAYEYTPVAGLKKGGLIAAGTIIGAADENALMSAHAVMVPPNMSGEIVRVYGAGTDGHESFTLEDPLMDIRDSRTGRVRTVTMSHYWPVRKPRPIANKLPGNKALITGQRVLDVLFPCVLRMLLTSLLLIPLAVQVCAGRHVCYPWGFWLRQNLYLPGPVQVLKHPGNCIRGVW